MDKSAPLFLVACGDRIQELNRLLQDRRSYLLSSNSRADFMNDPYYRELEGARNEVVNCLKLLREVGCG